MNNILWENICKFSCHLDVSPFCVSSVSSKYQSCVHRHYRNILLCWHVHFSHACSGEFSEIFYSIDCLIAMWEWLTLSPNPAINIRQKKVTNELSCHQAFDEEGIKWFVRRKCGPTILTAFSLQHVNNHILTHWKDPVRSGKILKNILFDQLFDPPWSGQMICSPRLLGLKLGCIPKISLLGEQAQNLCIAA